MQINQNQHAQMELNLFALTDLNQAEAKMVSQKVAQMDKSHPVVIIKNPLAMMALYHKKVVKEEWMEAKWEGVVKAKWEWVDKVKWEWVVKAKWEA